MKYNILIFKNYNYKKILIFSFLFLLVFFFNLILETQFNDVIDENIINRIFGFIKFNDLTLNLLIYKIVNILYIFWCVEMIYSFDIDYFSEELLLRFGKYRWSKNKMIIIILFCSIIKSITYLILMLFVKNKIALAFILKDYLFVTLQVVLLINYLSKKINHKKICIIFFIIYLCFSLTYIVLGNFFISNIYITILMIVALIFINYIMIGKINNK